MAEIDVEVDGKWYAVGYDWEPGWPREEPSFDSPGDPGQEPGYVIHVIDGADVDEWWESESGATYGDLLEVLTQEDPERIMGFGGEA